MQMQDMPPRLATLIDRVQGSASYQDILDALSVALRDMDDRAQFYQWRWNKRDKDGLMPVGVASVRLGGPFWRFRPEERLKGMASYVEAADRGFDEIDDGIDDELGNGVVEEVGTPRGFDEINNHVSDDKNNNDSEVRKLEVNMSSS